MLAVAAALLLLLPVMLDVVGVVCLLFLDLRDGASASLSCWCGVVAQPAGCHVCDSPRLISAACRCFCAVPALQ
jgi:hypothetical protein